jgi:hypothetical protein
MHNQSMQMHAKGKKTDLFMQKKNNRQVFKMQKSLRHPEFFFIFVFLVYFQARSYLII